MRRSLYPSGLAVKAVTPNTYAVDGEVNGDTVDRYQVSGKRGNFHGGVLFVASAGALTDGTYTFAVQDSEDGTTWAAASAYDVQGGPAVIDAANEVVELGYNGTKRYCRLVMTVAGATTGATVGAVAVLDGGGKRAV